LREHDNKQRREKPGGHHHAHGVRDAIAATYGAFRLVIAGSKLGAIPIGFMKL
jgi:hypothetical protein